MSSESRNISDVETLVSSADTISVAYIRLLLLNATQILMQFKSSSQLVILESKSSLYLSSVSLDGNQRDWKYFADYVRIAIFVINFSKASVKLRIRRDNVCATGKRKEPHNGCVFVCFNARCLLIKPTTENEKLQASGFFTGSMWTASWPPQVSRRKKMGDWAATNLLRLY